MAAKPSVLVLGGLGFIGRNFVEYLLKNDLVGKVRIADKLVTANAYLSPEHQKLFEEDPRVDYKQVNLARTATINKIFEGETVFDFVVNCAGETKYSQGEVVYKENILDVSVTAATAAAQRGVKRYIEISTAQVYESSKKPTDENGSLKPWTKLAEYKLEAEKALKKISGLNLIVVRPAIVYGPGDITGLTHRFVCGAVYKQLGETMEFLWDEDLKYNTVHVQDVAAALWFLLNNGTVGETYNLSDGGDTTVGTVANLISKIFGVKTKFMGYMASKVATGIAMKSVAEAVNEKHLSPWSELCKANNIHNSPLTPYLDEELLYHDAYSIDGTKITKSGFKYQHPALSEEEIRATLKYFIDLNFFPKGLFV